MSRETYEVDVRMVENNGEKVYIAHADGVGDLFAVADSYLEALDGLRSIAAWRHVVRRHEEAERDA